MLRSKCLGEAVKPYQEDLVWPTLPMLEIVLIVMSLDFMVNF